MMKRLWCEDEGILTFEWIMLLTLLVIGVIGGVAAIRDAITNQASGVVGAMLSLNKSYYVTAPTAVGVFYPGSTGSTGTSPDTRCTSLAAGSYYNDNTNVYSTGRGNYGTTATQVAGGLCSVTFPITGAAY